MSFVIARDICFMPIDTGSAAMPSSSHPTFNSLHPDFADTRQPAHHALRPSSLLELFACIPSLKDRYLGRGVAKKLKHPRTLGPCRPRFKRTLPLPERSNSPKLPFRPEYTHDGDPGWTFAVRAWIFEVGGRVRGAAMGQGCG